MSDKLPALRKQLNSPAVRGQLKAALPADLPVDRFVRVVTTTLTQNPDLANKCSEQSFMESAVKCAQLGLVPDSFMGQAYFIPRNGQCQLQVGYQGLLELARRSGKIKAVRSGVVHENDTYELTEEPFHFTFTRCMTGDRGKPIFGYAVLELEGGESQYEIMSYEDIEAIRKAAPSANSPAWKSHWGQMARKTVLKRALNYAPKSIELSQALAYDNEPYEIKDVGGSSAVKATPAKQSPRLNQLKQQPEINPEDIDADPPPDFDPEYDPELDQPQAAGDV